MHNGEYCRLSKLRCVLHITKFGIINQIPHRVTVSFHSIAKLVNN